MIWEGKLIMEQDLWMSTTLLFGGSLLPHMSCEGNLIHQMITPKIENYNYVVGFCVCVCVRESVSVCVCTRVSVCVCG